jgi:dTDP-4-amino-4,6-dideoxygalactose transaminase
MNYNLQDVDYNYAYFPVVMEGEEALLKVMNALSAKDISTRRYFFPALNTLNYVQYRSCPVAENITKRVFCLPLYHELKEEEQALICKLIDGSC